MYICVCNINTYICIYVYIYIYIYHLLIIDLHIHIYKHIRCIYAFYCSLNLYTLRCFIYGCVPVLRGAHTHPFSVADHGGGLVLFHTWIDV